MNDYHLHTLLCRHGEGHAVDYARAAAELGLTEIGFAEHIPLPQIKDFTGRMHLSEFAEYQRQVEAAQKQFPQLKIRFGLEADYLPQHLDYIKSFIQAYPFDYVIGSVHFIGNWNFDHPDYAAGYADYGVDNVFRDYYRLLREAASCGLFDIIGHFDLPKKFGHQPKMDLSEDIDLTLKTIKEHDLVLDVNTAGLRKQAQEIYPSPAILQRAYELSIPIILGSDAHRPGEVAFHFTQAMALLRQIGYNACVGFSRRKRYTVPFTL